MNITGNVNTVDAFLDTIKNNAVTYGYILIKDSVSGTRELILKNLKNQHIAFKLNSLTGNNKNVYLNAFTTYNNTIGALDQAGSLSKYMIDNFSINNSPAILLKDTSIYYNIVITDNKISGIYSIDGTWFSFYIGNFSSYGDNIQYPNPLYVGGNCTPIESIEPNLLKTHNIVLGRGTGASSGSSGNYVQGALNQNNQWIIARNEREDYTNITYHLAVQPFYKTNSFKKLCPDLVEKQVLFPVVIQDISAGFYLGELEGVYATSSYNSNNNNSIVNINTKDFVLVNTTHNNQNKDNGMLAIQVT